MWLEDRRPLLAKDAQADRSEEDPISIARIAAPLRRQVAEQLRIAIIRSDFAPGERLVERDLCERYDVSRTVIREALRQLEADGLVSMVANRGPVVTILSREDAEALYEVRATLEPLAGSLCARRASKEQVRRLTTQFKAVRAAILDDAGLETVIAEKDAFYVILLEGCGNPVITALFQTIQARIQVLRRLSLSSPGRGRQTINELRAVLVAVQRGDSDAAWAACEAHVNSAAEIALSRLNPIGSRPAAIVDPSSNVR